MSKKSEKIEKNETAKVEKTVAIHIAPPNMQVGEVWIRGTAPLVMHKFSHKAKQQIKEKQEAGSTATKNKKKAAEAKPEANREPKA